MHGQIVTERTSTPTASTTPSTSSQIKTHIWRNARTDNGYYLDIFEITKKSEQQHLQIID